MATQPSNLGMGDLTPIQRDALDWIGKLYSGNATKADFAAWEKWRAQSPAHVQAYELAQKIIRFTGSHQQLPDEDLVPIPLYERPLPRRAALAGLVAIAGGYGLMNPPLGIWPSLAELSSDYRTKVGEQRKLALADGLSVELNTATSLSLKNQPGRPGIKLISGEVAVNADLPDAMRFVADTGDGGVVAQNASFNLRTIKGGFRATCVAGTAVVRQKQGEVPLQAGEAVMCMSDAQAPGRPFKVDADVATAWRHGLIVFRNASLGDIVAEINRYRRGEIILLSPSIANRRLSGSFSIKQLDQMVGHLSVFVNVTVSTLPGGIVLLS